MKATDVGTMDKPVLRTSTLPNALTWNPSGTHCAVVFYWDKNKATPEDRQMVIIKTDALPKVRIDV